MNFKSRPSLFLGRIVSAITRRGRGLLLFIGSMALSIALLEILSPLVYSSYEKKDYSKSDIQARLAVGFGQPEKLGKVLRTEGLKRTNTRIVHPYLGFVNDYTRSSRPVNRYGFEGAEPPAEKSEDTVIVAITGGSLAQFLYRESAEKIAEMIGEIDALSNKNVKVICLALGGYKQPQQLFTLTYFLALGYEFDIVINLDGFNEIALPPADNVARGTVAYFPRNWSNYAKRALDMDATIVVGKLFFLREKREKVRGVFSGPLLRRSNFALIFWHYIDRRYHTAEQSLQKEIEYLHPHGNLSQQASGPFSEYESDAAMFVDLVNIWKRSSKQMAGLCEANGIEYFHFLQPNQYFKGSKVLTDEEQRLAITREPYSYRNFVEAAYELLVEEGRTLREEGVNFVDFTMIFKEEQRTVYCDMCCHVNELGNEILAREIVEIISEELRQPSTISPSPSQ